MKDNLGVPESPLFFPAFRISKFRCSSCIHLGDSFCCIPQFLVWYHQTNSLGWPCGSLRALRDNEKGVSAKASYRTELGDAEFRVLFPAVKCNPC